MTVRPSNPPNRVREWRKARKLTLIELADRANIDQGYLQKMEVGERPIKLEWLQRIATGLDVNIGDLLNAQDNPNSLSADERYVVDAMRTDNFVAHLIKQLTIASTDFKPCG